MSALVPRERIEQTILVIRGHNVMLVAIWLSSTVSQWED